MVNKQLIIGIIVILFILESCGGYTPLIKNANGQLISNSIAIVDHTLIGGVEQGFSIRGYDKNNPILLFLHGGPGLPELGAIRKFNGELEKFFTVVCWDQRGCGLSYSDKLSTNTLNINQIVSDTIEMTIYLTNRFHQNKIFILAHSSGSIFGILAAYQKPDLYYAYIASGQMVNPAKAENIAYQYCLDSALQTTNDKALNELRDIGYPVNGLYTNGKYSDFYQAKGIQFNWLIQFGGIYFNKNDMMKYGLPMMFSDEYSVVSSFSYFGKPFENSMRSLWPQIVNINLSENIKELKIPVVFINGINDYDTPCDLISNYLTILQAPYKKIFYFNNSAHLALYEESDKFNQIMIHEVLKLTNQ